MSKLADRIRPLLPAFGKEDLEIVVDLVVLIAYSDGEVDGDELEALRDAFETIFQSTLSVMVVKTLIGSSVDEIKASGADAFASQLGKDLAEHGKGAEGLRVAYTIALASQDIGPDERERLVLIAEGAGISEAEQKRIEAEVRG